VQARPDGWTCHLCGKPIPRSLPREHPQAWQAHHTRDRRLVGDDLRFIVPSHRLCNQKAGQPGRVEGEHEVPGWLADRLLSDRSNRT
jgi:hypothetical protein